MKTTSRSKTLLVGDVVSLGGTRMKMIVKNIEGEYARCVWLDLEGQINEYPFQIQILEKQDGKSVQRP